MLERGLRCAGVSIERSQLLLWFTVLRWAVLEWPVWRADVQVRWFELHLGFSVLRGQLHCGLLRLHCHQLQPGEQLGLPFGGRLRAPQQRDSDLRGDGLWHSGLLLLGVHPVRRWLWLLCQQLPEDLPAVDGAGLHQRLDLRRRVGMDHLRRLSVKTHGKTSTFFAPTRPERCCDWGRPAAGGSGPASSSRGGKTHHAHH